MAGGEAQMHKEDGREAVASGVLVDGDADFARVPWRPPGPSFIHSLQEFYVQSLKARWVLCSILHSMRGKLRPQVGKHQLRSHRGSVAEPRVELRFLLSVGHFSRPWHED